MDKYITLLKETGLKVTNVRLEVLRLLEEADVLYSAQDLYLSLTKNNFEANLSSVYRTLEKLVEVKLVNQINLDSNKHSLYEYNEHSHHHFLVCDDCNKVVVVKECPIDNYEEKLSESHGFDITDHKIEFHGKCSDCR